MYKFLLIEDNKEDAEACLDTILRMNRQSGQTNITVDVSDTFEGAMSEIKNDYHGVIVDIKLDGDNSGNAIIRKIIDEYRVPVAVMTGTPDTELEESSPIRIYKKGESSYEEIVNSLIKSTSTGLFNVIGGKGIIERVMNQIFWKNLYPQIHLWEHQRDKGVDTEKVLLRYAIAHIQELIDNEIPAYVTEEMYIKPPIDEAIKTGSILKSKRDGLCSVVLSPPCDLAVHNGKIKTDRILLCEIDDHDLINTKLIEGMTKTSKMEKCIAATINNNYSEYYHWLPSNSLFNGGYINFRKVLSYSPESLEEEYEKPIIKIQEYFVKSILGRFSSYYARQGQPDFKFEDEAALIVEKIQQLVNQ
ncbi:MAG: histidine kinase [Clostridiaceae bacterium BRH_c20a]|nr:MAG: histidine kinase [Clostridiaceae bacterium BRH_c20a]